MTLPAEDRRPLPPSVLAALRTLDAPPPGDYDDLIRWAETGLTVEVRCGASLRTAAGAGEGRVWHGVRVDPHTGEPTSLTTPRNRERVEALHFLAALTETPATVTLPCALVGFMVDFAFGPPASFFHPYAWSTRFHDRLAAIRTVVRTVQYLDAGLDPADWDGWLGYGLSVGNARFMAAFAEQAGKQTPVVAGRWLRALEREVDSGRSTWATLSSAETIGYWLMERSDRAEEVMASRPWLAPR